MPCVPVTSDVFWVGVNERTTDLFEGLWPIEQEGLSYNSYVIRDDKTVLIDLAKSVKTDDYFAQLATVTNPADLDYIVVNHMEPDHTGVLRILRKIAPNAEIRGTAKAVKMLSSFFGITEGVREVTDGETLDVGRHKLQFVNTPFVHWPETMMTYEATERILFSCDGFGGYGALRGAIFDDEYADLAFYEREALRYYANIVAKFHGPVLKAIDKLSDVPVNIIAPSHGLIWRKNPAHVVDLYRKWSRYGRGPAEPEVCLLYGSMYGNSEALMNAVAQGIAEGNVKTEIFDAARTHVSYILPALWRSQGIMIGAPTYEAGLFPPVASVIHMAAAKAVRGRTAALFGTYGWSGGALREFKRLIEPLKWELSDTLEIEGAPSEEDMESAKRFGTAFAERIARGATPGESQS